MKTQVGNKSMLSVALASVALAFIILGGCQKSSDTVNPGSDPEDPKGPGTNEIFIQNMAFSPSSISVAANTSITWTNKDAIAHTVTSTEGLFDSAIIPAGGTYSHTFAVAGTFQYICTLHPSMTASVKVD